ncbi:MAG TPA: hypothetical protein VF973_07395 [Myxococcales bacterium]
MTRKADPPSRRPSRRKPSRRPPAPGLAPQAAARASKARGTDEKLDCDFGLAFSVVPALRRPPDA